MFSRSSSPVEFVTIQITHTSGLDGLAMASPPGPSLDSLKASVGSDLEGEKAALMLKKLASREADRRAQLNQLAENSRHARCKARPRSSRRLHRPLMITSCSLCCRAAAAPNESCKAFLLRVDEWQQHSQNTLDRISKCVKGRRCTWERLHSIILNVYAALPSRSLKSRCSLITCGCHCQSRNR